MPARCNTKAITTRSQYCCPTYALLVMRWVFPYILAWIKTNSRSIQKDVWRKERLFNRLIHNACCLFITPRISSLKRCNIQHLSSFPLNPLIFHTIQSTSLNVVNVWWCFWHLQTNRINESFHDLLNTSRDRERETSYHENIRHIHI